MSLKYKYLLAAALSVLFPLLVYLLVDATLTRSFLIQDQVASLRLAATLMQSSLDVCQADCPRRAQDLLERFTRRHPEMDVLLLDETSTVRASSDRGLLNKVWQEPGIRRVLTGETGFSWDIHEHSGGLVLDVTVPWHTSDNLLRGAIHLGRDLPLVQKRIRDLRWRHAAFVILVALAVGAFLSLITYRLVIRPLGRLDQELRETHWPHLSEPFSPGPATGGDEITYLSAALRSLIKSLTNAAARLEHTLEDKSKLLARLERFNEDLEREVQKTRQELVRKEHMATIGQLSAGLAHELRNPLFIIRASAEAFRRKHPDAAEVAVDIIEEVDRVDTIISRLMELARPLAVRRDPLNVTALVKEVIALQDKALAPEHRIRLHLDCPVQCQISGDAAFLRQALSNLLDNARQAIDGEGEIITRVRREEDGRVAIAIADTGRGIAAEDQPRIFEPFFSRKQGGTGLGLAATKKILDLHGATVAVQSRPRQGTTVTVRLPAASEEEPA